MKEPIGQSKQEELPQMGNIDPHYTLWVEKKNRKEE